MLTVEDVVRRFGGVTALDHVSFEVADGIVFGIIGPNGSGKTTLFNAISGIFPPQAGNIRFGGVEIAGRPAHRMAGAGIARTFQTPRFFSRMSVRRNLFAALDAQGLRTRRRSGRADALLEAVGLAARADDLPGALTLPDQRRLELARALVADPPLLLLDEPAGGMTPRETQEMTRLIREVAAPGRTCLVIEHKMDMIFRLCARVAVLNFGRLIALGTPDEVRRDEAVRTAYLGSRRGAE